MKIGILTHHAVVNFGAFWQAYSLQQVIQREFPNAKVEIINFLHLKHLMINLVGWFWFYKNRYNIRNWNNIYRLPYTLYKARRELMQLSGLCLTTRAVNALKYDYIVVGSDEVWNFSDTKSALPIKFGCGIKNSKLISYAPSSANSGVEVPNFVRDGLKSFSSISVRDQSTARMVENVVGVSPPVVLDPTFLLDWNIQEKPPVVNKNYILMYYCEHLPEKIKNQIFEYASQRGWAVYGAGESDARYDECTVNLSPHEWVSMFKHAKFVFTGTFHGVVFSVLNRVPFKVYLTNPSRVAKVGNLLNLLGIEARNIEDGFVFDFEKQKDEVNYDCVQNTVARSKNQSLDFLIKSLN